MPGGRGRGGPMPRDVLVSKALSKLLRHSAEKEGLKLDEAGYINLKDVMNNQKIRSVKPTLDEIKQIVAENDKQRFSLIHKSAAASAASIPADDAATSTASDIPSQVSESDDPADYLIRANQGHSLEVASENLLTPITEENLPSVVVHGTTHAAWPQIVATGGLKRMARTHVHFASGLPAAFKSEDNDAGAAPVISGMRNSSSVLVYVDIKKALEAGVKFWKSENGVILSEGDENGVIGLQFFSRVEDRTGGQGVLVVNGKVSKEAPESWTKPKKANKPSKQLETRKDHPDEKPTAP
ncbi:phosphotransferase KptA/Tpt1, partial [Aureobasidium sp. EXF-3399]